MKQENLFSNENFITLNEFIPIITNGFSTLDFNTFIIECDNKFNDFRFYLSIMSCNDDIEYKLFIIAVASMLLKIKKKQKSYESIIKKKEKKHNTLYPKLPFNYTTIIVPDDEPDPYWNFGNQLVQVKTIDGKRVLSKKKILELNLVEFYFKEYTREIFLDQAINEVYKIAKKRKFININK